MIRCENVTKDYKLGKTIVHALKGVSLKIKKGDFVIIVGPSGSGKSTLLHVLGALDKPTSGKVYIDGKDISLMNDEQLALLRRKKIGFIFQTFNLIPTLNALENVLIPTFPVGERHEFVEKAVKLLTEVGLKHRMLHKPDELSGGERQRVAIARALINDPELVLADEPTGNLDSVTGEKVVFLMRKLMEEEGKTFVVVTHDPSLLEFATRKFALKDGKLYEFKKNHEFRKYIEG